MYLKNLDYRLNVRLNDNDMDFVKKLSKVTGLSFSQVVRGIIENYRLRYSEAEHEHDKTI